MYAVTDVIIVSVNVTEQLPTDVYPASISYQTTPSATAIKFDSAYHFTPFSPPNPTPAPHNVETAKSTVDPLDLWSIQHLQWDPEDDGADLARAIAFLGQSSQ